MTPSPAAVGRIKIALFILLLLPLFPIIGGALNSPDPVEHLTGETGEFALRVLVLALLVTPLRLATGWNWLLRTRRMIGLYAFFYAAAHFGVYVSLDRGFDPSTVLDDVIERKFITVGFAAFLLLLPLALTSNNWSVRKLGGKAWLKLHKLVYAIALLAPIHFFWLERGNKSESLVYLGIFTTLLALRIPKVRAVVFRGRK